MANGQTIATRIPSKRKGANQITCLTDTDTKGSNDWRNGTGTNGISQAASGPIRLFLKN